MAGIYHLLILSAMLSLALGCSKQEIDACFLPWDNYLESIHMNRTTVANGFHLSHLTDDELDEFCRIWISAPSPCLRSIRDNCSSDVKHEFIGIEEGYDFFCSTLDQFSKYKSCLNKDEVDHGLYVCQLQLTQDINDAFDLTDIELQFQIAICNAVHTAITCDYQVASTHCGQDAGQWTKDFQDLINSPYMDEVFSCSENGQCTQQNEEKCWKPVNTYLTTIHQAPIGYGEFDYRNLTTQQLSEFCVAYDGSTSMCLSTLKGTCSDFERKRFEGDEASLDFLCQTGLNMYIKHYDCLTKKETWSGEQPCYSQFSRDLDAVSNAKDMHQAYCNAIQGFISCKKEVVVQHCGDEAGEWMQEFDRSWLEPYLDGIECDNVATLHCTQDNINGCWGSADAYLSSIGKDRQNLGLGLSSLEDGQVRSYCDMYNKVVQVCLDKIKPFCDRTTRAIFQSQMHSLDYFCGSNLENNIKDRTCLMDSTVQSELDTCEETFNKAEHDSTTATSTSKEQDLYCEALDDYAQCDTDVVMIYCKGDSKMWTEEYLVYLRGPLYHSYCDSKDSNTTDSSSTVTVDAHTGLSGGKKAAIAICTLIAIALLVAAAIFGYYFYKKRKAIKDQTSHVRFENPLATDGGERQASAYIQNGGTAAEPEVIKTVPVDEAYTTPQLQAYDKEHRGAFPKPPAYDVPSQEATAPQYSTTTGYTSTEDVQASFPETDITTTTTTGANPMYDNVGKY